MYVITCLYFRKFKMDNVIENLSLREIVDSKLSTYTFLDQLKWDSNECDCQPSYSDWRVATQVATHQLHFGSPLSPQGSSESLYLTV